MGRKKRKKERLKPISFYGYDAREVSRAYMQISPKRLRELQQEERGLDKLTDQGADS